MVHQWMDHVYCHTGSDIGVTEPSGHMRHQLRGIREQGKKKYFFYFSSFLYGVLVGKLEEKMQFGRHGCRCNNIKMHLKDMG
jgi:hypothetical protein